MARALPQLIERNLTNTQTGDGALDELGTSCARLSTLALGVDATDDGLLKLIARPKAHLRRLRLCDKGISIDVLKEFVSKTPSLELIENMEMCYEEEPIEQYQQEIRAINPKMHF